MKRIATWLFATVGGIVLLFSYKTSTAAVAPAALPDAGPAPTSSTSAPAQPAPKAGTPKAAAPAAPATTHGLKDGTFTGASENTPYGPVQVKVTIAGGKVTDATAVDYPHAGGRDQMINSYAIPRLQAEAKGTTDGKIDMVSGATYTSGGYIGSLQDAVDQAR
ncbi:MAG: FMN-binding protein [Promicromonosporaceae bacterium]|nr:FMN-binding protein [Promicromonosporaceae bacterium]